MAQCRTKIERNQRRWKARHIKRLRKTYRDLAKLGRLYGLNYSQRHYYNVMVNQIRLTTFFCDACGVEINTTEWWYRSGFGRVYCDICYDAYKD